ncbi:Response regulator receiver domain-containing protein [Malonomonas rubra DSM 5091]|uniref:Response regulator receiver domain-containing protein n=1 Tax=Malonomonas rubra DSM 5091 TaxID=1122189 RepID=A0A1M6HY34_MALRU|nr:response regulator [Malonomonas rubra]SHJ27091.1 Response regulator receiver domain-containing protein [Malonomonas rubra DSM 5091]
MNPPPLKILAFDSEQLLLWALKRAGKSRSLEIETASSLPQAYNEIEQHHFDLYLIAYDSRDKNRLKLLQAIDEKYPYVPIIIMTTNEVNCYHLNDEIKSVRHHGSWHLLEKPFRLEKILGFIDLLFHNVEHLKKAAPDLVHHFDNEKRGQFRRSHILPLDYSYPSIVKGKEIKTYTSGIVTDISDCGLGLLSRSPLEEEMLIQFGDTMLRQYGIVAWSTKLEKETYRAGIKLC